MPHNLYAFVSHKREKVDYTDQTTCVKPFVSWHGDSKYRLSLAFVVNSLLILGAALFFRTRLWESAAFRKCTMHCKIRRLLNCGRKRSTLSTLFAVALLAKWSKLNNHRNIDRTNRDGRFLTYEITTMDYPSCDSFIRLTTSNRHAWYCSFARKTLDQLLVLLTKVFLSSGVTIFNLPIVYFTSKKCGQFTNANGILSLKYAVAVILTILNFKLILIYSKNETGIFGCSFLYCFPKFHRGLLYFRE